MQFGTEDTASHYDDDNGTSNPSGMTAESLHSSRRMGVYVVYEVGSETYVRRSGAWIKADSVQVRRLGAWADVGPDVYVRRGAVWAKAETHGALRERERPSALWAPRGLD